MTVAATPSVTLASALWPAGEGTKLFRLAALAVAGSLLLTLSAKVQVPFYPVPMTMQSFAVLVIGMAYGWRLGAATVLLYLAEGAAGLPVFAGTPEKGIGIPYMMGPTGGYLLGFLVAAAAVGWLAERGWDRNVPLAVSAMVIGTVLLFIPGVAWLAVLFGFSKAIDVGVTPFILASVVKLALAAAVMPLAWTLLGRAKT
ncbi:MAG: biotin transporter BioY [Rhodospirillales bacterium]|nr:biotin transporter BioY [Rhodospirillales bacterium]